MTGRRQALHHVVVAYGAWHREVRVTESASATAFWLLIACGPAGIVAINVLGLVVDQGELAEHLIAIAGSAPGSFADLVVGQLRAVARPSPGSIALDAVLVVTSLWTISTAVALLLIQLLWERASSLSPSRAPAYGGVALPCLTRSGTRHSLRP